MKVRNLFNKFIFTLLTLLSFGVVNAWGYYSAKMYVTSSPSAGGNVYVGNSNSCSSANCTSSTDNASSGNKGKLFSTSGNITFYLCNKPNDNYVFKGWVEGDNYKTKNTGDGASSNPWSKTVTGNSLNPSFNYYAIFARLTADKSSLSFGEKNSRLGWGNAQSVSVTYVHAGKVEAKITGTNASDFSFSTSSTQTKIVAENNTNTETSSTVTVYFNPQCNGTRTATLTFSGNGLTKTVTLTGTGVLNNQTLSWDNEDDIELNMLNGSTQTISATATSGLAVKYSSSNHNVLSVNQTTGELTALSVGNATIYANQSGDCKFGAADEIFKTFTVKSKDTPIFKPQGFSAESTCALKVGDKVTLEVEHVSAGLSGDFTASATQSSGLNVLSFTREGNTITIEAINAGNSTATFTQTENSAIVGATKSYSFSVSKHQTTFTGSAFNIMVDGVQIADYNYENVSATQPTANSADNFYYTIDNVSFTNEPKNNVNNNNLVTFNPANKQITACNAGTAKITLHQKETYKYTGATASFNVTVHKYKSAFSGAAALGVKVEANVTSGYTLTYSKLNNDYAGDVPVAGNPTKDSGDYYYTLTQNVTSDNTTGSADATIAAAYDAGTKKATGKNAGTCRVDLYQQETYKVTAASTNFTVTVTKNDPTFTWKAGPYYHNTTVSNIFSTSNTELAHTIGASTDAQVAYVSNNNLYVLSKNGTAQFTVTQGANYKWSGKSATYTVTPENPSNHVTFTYTQAMYNDGNITTSKVSATGTEWTSSGVRLGGSNTALVCSESTNWDDKYIDIKFLGIPEKVTFKIAVNSSRTTGDYWYVKESANGSTWSDEKWSSEHNGTSFSGTQTVNLSSSTRYIRLCYSGNYAGYFKDVTVHELKKFTPSETTLDFGANDINSSVASQSFDFNYANVGHNVTLSTNDSHFTVSPTSITNIGGEKTGAVTVTVNYSTAEEHKNTNAKLTITDELGNSTTVTLKGETKKLQPTITWSPDESIFNVEDVLRATNANELAVTLSVDASDEAYVACTGNTATMIQSKSGTVTVTAHVAGNDIYKDADFTKDITITNKEKQYINWDQDFSRLKTTDQTKSITLNATTTSGLPVTYELQGNATGLTLTQNGNTWTLTYSAVECKNTTIVAKQTTGNETYAPASSFSLPVKVIDPTKECDPTVVVINSDTKLGNSSQSKNIDIPEEMTIVVKRTNTEWYAVYAQGFDVEFYSGLNGTGNKIGSTHSYSASDINTSKTIKFTNMDRNIKSVKLISNALYGYTISSLIYTQQQYCELSSNPCELNFETYPNTTTSAKTFTINYANYPISLECSNSKFTISPKDFGDCGDKGTETISVTYTAGAAEGTDNGNILYIKDNTGKTLQTCTLNASISKVAQSITEHNIQTTYNTTDKVTLTAETNSAAEEKHFTYSAEPAGIASFDGNEMTFSQSGTIAITVREAGDNVYKPCSTTVVNVAVNKVTPTLTLPTGTSLTYLQNLSASTLSGGKATVTLRGVPDTEIEGAFTWTNTSAQATGAEGNSSYEVTFKPTNTGMYNNATGMVTIAVAKANQTLVMHNGTVSVAVDKGIDANSADSKLNLTTLIASQTADPISNTRLGAISYEVISANAGHATISGSIFSADTEGEYTIRATQASTNYYNATTAEFKVTVNVRANTLSVASTHTAYVGQEIENAVANINSDGTMHTSSTDETVAYYDIENNKIVTPNSEAKSFDQTKVTITIWQDANDQFAAAAAKTMEVTVKKYDNQIYKSWATWSQTLNFDQKIPVRLWSDNSETALEIDQTSNPSVATYYAYPSADKDTIRAWFSEGTTTWSISQAETYKYKAATAKTLTVNVEALNAPNDCYVLNETAEHTMGTTGITSLEGVSPIETSDSLELSAPGKDLYFDAKKDALGYNYFFIEYSTNGSQFKVLGDEVQLGSSYETYGPYELPEGTTHVRFKTTTGATLAKYYKNVRVTRKTYFDIEDKDGAKISSMDMPLNIVSNDPLNVNSSKKSFFIDYNTCDDIIRIASNHPYYTIKETDKAFSASATYGVGRREIEVTYTCATSDTSSAVISVYTKYDYKTITINGRTDKGTQELNWKKPDFESETVSLPVGYNGIAATVSSGLPLVYSIQQDEDSVIRIADDKYSFEVVGQGIAHLTVTQEGTSTLYPVTGTRTIVATGKKLQMIKWFQDLTNSLSEGDTVRLEAEVHVMNPKTGVYVRDNARTDSLRYTCPENNGKIVIFGKDSLRVIGTGDTYITASVGGDEFYLAAAPITMPIHIRSLSDTCESKLLVDSKKQYEFKPNIDWGFTNLTPTTAEYGDTILINQTVGKPDKLSFEHSGAAFVAPVIQTEYYQGYIKAQQRIRGAWVDVIGSRIAPTKGVWNELKDVQLDEDADAVMIMREQGAYGYHYVKNVKVTMLPYLRAADTIFISTERGTKVDTTITVQYGNVKAALMAETGRKENDIFVVRNAVFHPNCGTTGTYNWPIRFTPNAVGQWLDSVTIKDSGTEDSIVVYVKATVKPNDAYIWEANGGFWGDSVRWDHGEPPTVLDHVRINGDVTIPAGTTVSVKSLTIAENATVQVKGTLVLMESTLGDDAYGNIHVTEIGYLDLSNISEGGLKVKDFTLDASLGNVVDGARSASGQVNVKEKLIVNGDAYFQLTLDPSGGITFGWYDFVVPFEVDIKEGIYCTGAPDRLRDVVDFSIIEHSESERAQGKRGWHYIHNTLYPGRAYSITLDPNAPQNQNELRFKKKSGAALGGSQDFGATCSLGEPVDRGWNGLGNGTLQHAELRDLPEGTKVQQYDHENNVYVERFAEQFSYAIGTSFFMQVDANKTISLSPATHNRAFLAPARELLSVDEFMLSLMNYESQKTVDNLWMSATEEATESYVIGHDLLKLGTPTEAKIAQMWATKNGSKLCDIETALVNGNGYAPLSFFAPEDGEFILAVEAMPEDVMLFLTYNEQIVWELTASPYPIDLTKGVTDGYGLRVIRTPRMTTGISETGEDSNAVRKVIINDKLYIITPEGAIYDITGKNIK